MSWISERDTDRQTRDQSLADPVARGEVIAKVTKAAASNLSDFELEMRMFITIADTASDLPAVPPPNPEPAAAGNGPHLGGLEFLSQ